jgi:hypothetical protein
MKRNVIVTLVTAACLGLLLACPGPNTNGGSKYTVTFDKNTTIAGATISEESRKVEEGKAIGALPTGTSSTHTIVKWTEGSAATTATVTSDTKVTGDMTVYAQWGLKPYEGSATVTFNLNHDDTTGASAAPENKVVTDGKVGELPAPPTRSEGWGVGMQFDNWYTLATGGEVVTENTVVSSETFEVFARWSFTAGTPTVSGETLVHRAPQITSNAGDGGVQGSWSGTENDDGSITYSNGAVRYEFPAATVLASYDLFTVDYIFKGTNMKVITKQGTTNIDYLNMDGDDSQYPILSTEGGTLGPFAIKTAGENRGLALQRNEEGSGTVKFTTITYTKGTRHTITFDASDSESTPPYTGESIASIQAAEGIIIGPMPTPKARSGYNFAGWVDADDEPYRAGTLMPANDLALKAKWMEKQVLETLTVDFGSPTVITAIGTGSVVAALDDGTGYTYTYGSVSYEGAWSKFTVKLADNVSLADYDKIELTIKAEAGDTNYKPFIVLTGKTLPAVTWSSNPGTTANQYNCTTVNNVQFSSGTQTLTFTINQAKASAMTGDIEFAIYGHCGADSGKTKYTYSDFTIFQE